MKTLVLVTVMSLLFINAAVADNEQLVRDYYQASSSFDVKAMNKLLTPDFRVLKPGPKVGVKSKVISRDKHLSIIKKSRAAMQDSQINHKLKSIKKNRHRIPDYGTAKVQLWHYRSRERSNIAYHD